MSDKPVSIVHRPRQSQWTAIPMEDALATVVKSVRTTMTKSVPTALVRPGMVLADRVLAKINIPVVPTSIKDGYAVIASDGTIDRTVVSASTAGTPSTITVIPGTCARVSTGAAIPIGADAVIQVEDTELLEHDGVEELKIRVLKAAKEHQDIRPIGFDVHVGQVLLEKHCVISSAEIGILVASGQRSVLVFRKPKACVISTGNELVDWMTEDIPDNCIRDTNRPQLLALLNVNGFKAIDGGIVGDTREQLIDGIKVAFKFSNIIVMSGGVSMGEKDLVKSVLEKNFNFKIHFGRVFMKPGLPSTFATGTFETGDTRYVFALPGNPVSAWVCCQLFTVPTMRKMAGHLDHFPTTIKVKLAESIKLDTRPEYRRAWYTQTLTDGANGPWGVCTAIDQPSSSLLNTRGANLLLQLPPKADIEEGRLEKGVFVDALVIGRI